MPVLVVTPESEVTLDGPGAITTEGEGLVVVARRGHIVPLDKSVDLPAPSPPFSLIRIRKLMVLLHNIYFKSVLRCGFPLGPVLSYHFLGMQ